VHKSALLDVPTTKTGYWGSGITCAEHLITSNPLLVLVRVHVMPKGFTCSTTSTNRK